MRVAYIDHSFHRRTNSTGFLVDILKRHADVEVFWDESWEGGKSPFDQVLAGGYDAVVLFQVFDHFDYDRFRRHGMDNITIIPMFDHSWHNPDQYWGRHAGAKVLNFSSTLHARLQRLRLMSHYSQYYPPMAGFDTTSPAVQHKDSIPSAFFWQRTGSITWSTLKQLIGKTPFRSIHLHAAMDPEQSFERPSADDIERYHISTSDWFENRDEYWQKVDACDVYFAPRLYEGIGQSFLEALSLGKCVVAPNRPTMNEYIRHGVDGYLYEPRTAADLDFSNLDEIRGNARIRYETGLRRWREGENELADFILHRRISPIRKWFTYGQIASRSLLRDPRRLIATLWKRARARLTSRADASW